MTNSSLWSIKIENGQVFIYLGKEKLKMHQVCRRVLSVKKSLYKGKDALLVRTNLFTWLIYSFFSLRSRSRSSLTFVLYVIFLQFKFEPCPNGAHTKCHLKLKCFDPYASDGIFRDIQKACHKDFVCHFNQQIARVETIGHYATNVESESSPIRTRVASAHENEEHDTSTDKTSQSG